MIKLCNIFNYSNNLFISLIITFVIYLFVKKSNKNLIKKLGNNYYIKKMIKNKKKNNKKFSIIFTIITFIVFKVNAFQLCLK